MTEGLWRQGVDGIAEMGRRKVIRVFWIRLKQSFSEFGKEKGREREQESLGFWTEKRETGRRERNKETASVEGSRSKQWAFFMEGSRKQASCISTHSIAKDRKVDEEWKVLELVKGGKWMRE